MSGYYHQMPVPMKPVDESNKILSVQIEPPYYNVGWLVYFPNDIVQKIGAKRIVDVFTEMYGGAKPIKHEPVGYNFLVECHASETREEVQKFIDTVLAL
jgi:hypothetical protein